MSGSTPPLPVRAVLRLAPPGGAWPRHPVVLRGQYLRLYAEFFDVTGAAMAPEDVAGVVFRVLHVETGAGVEIPAGDGQGIAAYSAGILCTLAGHWRAEVECTGPSAAIGEVTWSVQERALGDAAGGGDGWVLGTTDGFLIEGTD